MLFYPERHEPLSRTPWDETAARDAIAEIVTDTEARFDATQFWPAHPREDGQGVLKGLWFGAAGAIWALQSLSRLLDRCPQNPYARGRADGLPHM
jgi:hypothetical protein